MSKEKAIAVIGQGHVRLPLARVIVLAVVHSQFTALDEQGINAWGQPSAVLFDFKSILPLGTADGRL